MAEASAHQHGQSPTGRALAFPVLLSRRTTKRLLAITGFVVLIVGWHLLATSGLFARSLVPKPETIVGAFGKLFASGEGQEALLASTTRVLFGVVIGVSLAIPVGLLLGWFWPIHALVDPQLNFFRALPPIALIPLVVVYLGIGENARVFILAWSSFFVSVIIIYEGTVSLDPVLVKAAQVLGASQREVLTKVVLPMTVPVILVAVRVAVASGWGTLVASELLAAQTGLGATISQAANFFQMDRVYAGIIMIGVMALIMDKVGRTAILRVVQWQDRVER